MAALPLLSSYDEEWGTARVLRDRQHPPDVFPTELDDADLALMSAAACGASSVSMDDKTGAAHMPRTASADSKHAQSSNHSRVNTPNAGSA
eukprot:194778-Pleurochrysis_carterae.AAC.2